MRGTYGLIEITESGKWKYTLDNPETNSELKALMAGQNRNDVFVATATYDISDDQYGLGGFL